MCAGESCRRKRLQVKGNGLEEMRVMKQVTGNHRVFRRDGGEGWTDRVRRPLFGRSPPYRTCRL